MTDKLYKTSKITQNWYFQKSRFRGAKNRFSIDISHSSAPDAPFFPMYSYTPTVVTSTTSSPRFTQKRIALTSPSSIQKNYSQRFTSRLRLHLSREVDDVAG